MSITALTRHEVPLNYFNGMNHFINVSGVSESNIRSPSPIRIKLHVRDPNLFPGIFNEYILICLTSKYMTAEYDMVLRQDKLIYRRQITA